MCSSDLVCAVLLIINISASHIETVCPILRQDLYHILGHGITAEPIIIGHIHIVYIVTLQYGIPEVAPPYLPGGVGGGVQGVKIMVAFCTVVIDGAVYGAGRVDGEGPQLFSVGIVDFELGKPGAGAGGGEQTPPK